MAWSSYIPIGTQILATTYTMTLRWYLELAFYILFWSLRSQESNTSNDLQIGVEMRKIWMIEENYTMRNQMSVNFVWTCEIFTWSCEMDHKACFCSRLKINLAWTCKFLHDHAKCAIMMLECCQFIYILHDHAKWIILMQNQHFFH